MENSENVIGENIRFLRKRRNLSQAQLAKALNISAATLSSYETGKTIPTKSLILKASSVFEVSTDTILDIKAKEKEPDYIL